MVGSALLIILLIRFYPEINGGFAVHLSSVSPFLSRVGVSFFYEINRSAGTIKQWLVF